MEALRPHRLMPGARLREALSRWAESYDEAIEEVWEPFLELDRSTPSQASVSVTGF